LGDNALRSAIYDFYRKYGETDKIEIESGRIIDKVLKITDLDIEEAVLDGAVSLEDVQRKTKVGTGDPSCIPEVEQLIRFYREKYFGAE
jgi:NAD(P)H-nitrite reductase large subunit